MDNKLNKNGKNPKQVKMVVETIADMKKILIVFQIRNMHQI